MLYFVEFVIYKVDDCSKFRSQELSQANNFSIFWHTFDIHLENTYGPNPLSVQYLFSVLRPAFYIITMLNIKITNGGNPQDGRY